MPEHVKHTAATADQVQQPVRDEEHEQSADDEPMTDAQAATLKRLCEEAHEPQAFDGELTRSEAAAAIADMRHRIGSQH